MNKQMLAGAVGAGGLVIQIIIGFALAASGDPKGSELIALHLVIGIGGLALVAYLVSSMFFVPSSFIARAVAALAFILTLAQVALGFRLLTAPDEMLLMAHEGIALLILVLLAIGGMLGARSRRSMVAAATATQK